MSVSDISDRLAGLLGGGDDLVVNIGDIARVGDVALAIDMAQQPIEHVEDHHWPRIADMGEVIDRRPADIEPDVFRVDRREGFLGAAQGVVERQAHGQFLPLKALTIG